MCERKDSLQSLHEKTPALTYVVVVVEVVVVVGDVVVVTMVVVVVGEVLAVGLNRKDSK